MPDSIYKKITVFYDALWQDGNHRYKSWEHCYSYFLRKAPDPDVACINLAFYLASWGMYRGSSFLLWKDYKVHHEVVKYLISKKAMQGLDFAKKSVDIALILDAAAFIKNWYQENITYVNGKIKAITVSDTLATKILLGTLGCVPAFDRLFLAGMKEKGLAPLVLNDDSLGNVVLFYQTNVSEFKGAQKYIVNKGGIRYPAMKLVDMYFWQIGYEKELKQRDHK